MSAQTPVPGLLRSFSGDYLAAQRDVSQNTIYAYRDAIKLFLRFAARHQPAASCSASSSPISAPAPCWRS